MGGGEELSPAINIENSTNFCYAKDWITLDNIIDLSNQCLNKINETTVDVISLDLDGNDIYFVERILSAGFKPKLFIVEYNAKFPPPIEFSIAYDPKHQWIDDDDYFGASLMSFAKLFNRFDYRLICCNAHTGANAFFIDSRYSKLFADVPIDIEEIYVSPRYYLYKQFGHKKSNKTIERLYNAP